MATLTITSTNGGTYDFGDEELPVIQRGRSYERQSDQGPSRSKITVGLKGFFEGDMHSEVVAKYQTLLSVLQANDAVLNYHDGVAQVINDRVYLSSYNEPSDWKQYDGTYDISLYYFDAHANPTADLGISASYSSSAGSHSFDPVPHWSRSYSKGRSDPHGPNTAPSGAAIQDKVQFVLTGFLTGTSHSDLVSKISSIETALGADGTLTYGDYTDSVRVVDFKLPNTFPRDYVNYSITFEREVSGIRSIKSKSSFTRIHNFPIIRNRPYCPTPDITTFPRASGQVGTYDIRIDAESVSAARTLLATEAAALIVPGGIEMEGGKEDWDHDKVSVHLNVKKYYATAVNPNLAGT